LWVLVTLKENIKKILEDLSIGKNISDVFSDVIICSAYSLANLSCFNQERENQYNYIIGKYGKDKEKQVASILVMLLKAYSRNNNQDILGEIYEELQTNKRKLGQVFTPFKVADLLSNTVYNEQFVETTIKEKNFISVYDPACGTGRLLYSSYDSLLRCKAKPEDIFIMGGDLDLLCCCITYVQLSLMGVNAVINHQDTLEMKIYDTFYTFDYITNKNLQKNISNYIEESKREETTQSKLESEDIDITESMF